VAKKSTRPLHSLDILGNMSKYKESSDQELGEAARMLATIQNERAKLKVQRLTNGHDETFLYDGNKTYVARLTELEFALDNLAKEYPSLFTELLQS
jgi:hypothetical protein